MKYNKIIFTFLSLSFLLLYACKDDEDILSGTTWKLEAFVDDNTGEKIIRSEEHADCYTIEFFSKGKFHGYTVSNKMNGNYKINSSKQTIEFSFEITLAPELFEGKRFDSAISNAYSYSLSGDYLKIYYENNIYLLMKKQ